MLGGGGVVDCLCVICPAQDHFAPMATFAGLQNMFLCSAPRYGIGAGFYQATLL